MLELEIRTPVGPLEVDVRLAVEQGECLALAGPSGAGKTSVLRIVAGLTRPAYGRVRCGEELWLDTERGVDLPPDRRRVGLLFQEYALFPNMDALSNVAYPMADLPRAERRERAHDLLERFALSDRATASVANLSGGERQRVALARALARRPQALLLDEPLSALDTRTRARSGRELGLLLREAGVPVVIVTHDFEEAATLADRIAVIDAGRVVQTGAAAELTAKPASAFVADLTGAVVMIGEARDRGDGLTEVALDGGGLATSTDTATGRVAVSVHPWEITLEPAGPAHEGSAQNRLLATITSVTPVANRVRVGLLGPQALTAEITAGAAQMLALEPGVQVVAVFKATATRLVVC